MRADSFAGHVLGHLAHGACVDEAAGPGRSRHGFLYWLRAALAFQPVVEPPPEETSRASGHGSSEAPASSHQAVTHVTVVATAVRAEAVTVVREHRLAAAGGGPLVIDPSRHISPTQKPVELTDTRTGTRRAAVRIRSFHDDDVPLEVLPVHGTVVLLAAPDTPLPTDRWTPLPAQTGDPVEHLLEQHLRLPADDEEN
ncbi:hypothetical protein [Streptomyces sp. H51]|uniref:hypothetical protein n=1 Tax=Streptomyces sp. H51 TaxID=3111770 RepID=UPI002D78C3FC|nr:hypothetical protein [Streptomyces sp. H51]